MWDFLLTKKEKKELGREFSYATHHHLVPLYAISGVLIVALIVLGCFLTILWQQFNEREAFRPLAALSVQAHEDLYVPAVIVPAEKKQYIPSANIRFMTDDPYNAFRYEFDPGLAASKTSSTIILTTYRTLQELKAPIISDPSRVQHITKLQQCSRLYVIRFEPGLTPFGNFAPLKDVKLKDGRTAYLHKNAGCVPSSTQEMNRLDTLEKTVLSIESY